MTDTSMNAPKGALLNGPEAAKSAEAPVIVQVAKTHGVSPLRQLLECWSMRGGVQKLGSNEYYSLGLFDPAMPRDAKGIAFFEINHPEDVQNIAAPKGIAMQWLIHPNTHAPSRQLVDAVIAWDWPEGRVQTCIAGESTTIKALRSILLSDKGLPKEDCYISGYWKIGLIEDEHQQMKRAEAAA